MFQFDPKLQELLVRHGGAPTGEALDTNAAGRITAVLARLKDRDKEVDGLHVVTRMGEIVTGRVRLKDIVSVRKHPNVASLKASSLFSDDSNANGVPLRCFNNRRMGSAGVAGNRNKPIVGIVDWGLDFAHPAFTDSSGNTRILGIWDQRVGAGSRTPMPYGYGVEYTAANINAALRKCDPYQFLKYDPAEIDPSGIGTHGTHVCSIAAGRSWAKGAPEGVAPDADILFVHLRNDDTHPKDSLGDSARVLEAVDYILRRAGDRPVAINLSLGRTGDSKDGTTPVEQALDGVLEDRPNRCICMSTGNYYIARMHAGHESVQRKGQLRWRIPPFRKKAAELEVWYPRDDRLQLWLRAPDGATVVRLQPGDSVVKRSGTNRKLLVTAYSRLQDPNNGDNLINIFIHPSAASGQWSVELHGNNAKDVSFHAWIERTFKREQSRFHANDVDPSYSIGTICCGHNTIATAAYDNRARTKPIAVFSSSGPSRDQRMVPVVAAPGDSILAAKSTSIDHLGFRSTARLVRKSGTSMAAPVVTGAAALLLQSARRPLWASEVKDALILTADTPSLRENRLRSGAGLLNIRKALKFVSKL